MHDSTPNLRPNQSQSCEKRQDQFTIVPQSIDDFGLSAGATRTYRRMKRLIETAPGGALDWAVGRITALLGLAESTYHGHRRELEGAGLWKIERRRVRGCRFHETNLLRLGAPIQAEKGGGAKIRTQVEKINTKTTTPRVAAQVTPPKSYAQLRWEHQRQHNHPPAMRALYERNAAIMAENNGLRHRVRCDGQRERMDAEARVGMYMGPPKPEPTDEWRAEYWARQRALREAR